MFKLLSSSHPTPSGASLDVRPTFIVHRFYCVIFSHVGDHTLYFILGHVTLRKIYLHSLHLIFLIDPKLPTIWSLTILADFPKCIPFVLSTFSYGIGNMFFEHLNKGDLMSNL